MFPQRGGAGHLLYALYAIVEHSGGVNGGHYVAYVRTNRPPNPPLPPLSARVLERWHLCHSPPKWEGLQLGVHPKFEVRFFSES